MSKKPTPLMKQYYEVKSEHPDTLLLFRVGDFYETFSEDAIITAKVLDIVLTKRANGSASSVELAGFPHHALDTHLPKLIKAGHKVAICEQLEDPSKAKGLVRRGITEIVTPGLSIQDNILDSKKNNYLASINFSKDVVGISLLELSTGEFLIFEGNICEVEKILSNFTPSEILFNKKQRKLLNDLSLDKYNLTNLGDWAYEYSYCEEKLNTFFNVHSLKGYGLQNKRTGISAAGAIIKYLEDTKNDKISHIDKISLVDQASFLWMDGFTIQNLELISTQDKDGVSLFQLLDRTNTPMGARLLQKWIIMPLISEQKINERLDIVDQIFKNSNLRNSLTGSLKKISDLERLSAKVSTTRINPRELISLKNSLIETSKIGQSLKANGLNINPKGIDNIPPELADQIGAIISDEPPINISLGNFIKKGVDQELDEIRSFASHCKEQLDKIRERESCRTGISSLKISQNKVFGFYLEVTNSHKNKVPREWIRKQTLTNAERYITPELKEFEEKILSGEDRISQIEQRIYWELVESILPYLKTIQDAARDIARIDCLNCFAINAVLNNYHKPTLVDQDIIQITNGRHPVIEKTMPVDKSFIPNDIHLSNDQQQIMIITGPNMAGKSAILRQTALISIMAQMGSFVPAQKLTMGILDKIFTRVGARDNISKGESTFMVEMSETAQILNNLSNRSLVIMDEIGRGTSTYDGIAMAQSIVEFLHQTSDCPLTLFATHYHELNSLAESLDRVKNFSVSVKEIDEKIIFLHKLVSGGSQHSFGINVAEMAGIPRNVVARARIILDNIADKQCLPVSQATSSTLQLKIFEDNKKESQLIKSINNIDINTISPVEALMKLNVLKKIVEIGTEENVS